MRNTIVINFFGAPGAGKSTAKAGLFFLMKHAGHVVESVDEYAKELVYEGNFSLLRNQMRVFQEQRARLTRLLGKVDYILTDSPLLLSSYYAERYPDSGWNDAQFHRFVRERFDEFRNINIWVARTKHYQEYGRTQTLEESDAIAEQMLSRWGSIMRFAVLGNEQAPAEIYSTLVLTGVIKQ